VQRAGSGSQELGPPREAVESPSLEIFQPCLAAVLCPLLWVTLLGQGVGLGDPQRALPTLTMLGFCDQARLATTLGCCREARGLPSATDTTCPSLSCSLRRKKNPSAAQKQL